MKRLFKSFILLFLLLPFVAFGQLNKNDTILLVFLGGQSNMDGYGYNSELPGSLKTPLKNIWIFHGNPVPDEEENGGLGIWEILKPGHGVGFSSNGQTNTLSNRFGVELAMAEKLQELYPNQKIALIKYSRGGTSIDSLAAANFGSWEPDFVGTTGVNQYDHFLATIRNAVSFKDIDGNGELDHLVPAGIVWMQGESDAAHTEEIASNYFMNLKRLMDLIRAAFHSNDMPVVLGKISDSWNDVDGKVWDYGELVQYAQEKYAKSDPHAAIVRNTRYYKYSDPWHYNSEGYIDLGKKFAEALYKLNHKN